MLYFSRRADAPVTRTATSTRLGVFQHSQRRFHQQAHSGAVHRLCAPQNFAHKRPSRLRALENAITRDIRGVSITSTFRSYATSAGNKADSTSKQETDEARELHQLQETFESPPHAAESVQAELEGDEEVSDERQKSEKGDTRHGVSNTNGPRASSPPGIWTTLRDKLQQAQNKGPATGTDDDVSLNLEHEVLRPKNLERDERVGAGEEKQDHSVAKASSKRGAGGKTKPGKKSKTLSKKALNNTSKTIRPVRIPSQPLDIEQGSNVPQLSHHLDRVLFNPGVYQLQDERSRVFNFDPYLATIMPIEEFDFSALKSYVTSSKDPKLRHLSAEAGLKYCGSTSSMTSILSHFHYLLSAWRPPVYKNLSRSLKPDSFNFTVLTRAPAAAFLHHEDGVYAIDADKGFDSANVLTLLGQSMEKLLTLPKEEFERYRKSRSHEFSNGKPKPEEAYHYTKIGDMLIRSQLDAHDPRLPGSGMFDLKTRAVVTIRMDVGGYEKGTGYELRKRFGQWESFEREYYDMIRAAFLKYSLQVRMGRMDGIFVAYHNTQRIFGFQYVSLPEMDEALHGTSNTLLGNSELKASVAILNDLLNKATERFPGRTLRLHVETRETRVPLTYFFVEPVSEEEMKQIQESKRPEVERFERGIRGFKNRGRNATSTKETEAAATPSEGSQQEQQQEQESDGVAGEQDTVTQDDPAWKDLMTQLERIVENESLGVRCVRHALEGALKQRGLFKENSTLETERHLDSLTEALTLHLHEANRAGDEVQQNTWDDEQDATVSADVAVNGEPDDTPTEAEEYLEDAKTDEVTEFDPEPATAPEIAALKDLILEVTDGIEAKTQRLRVFEEVFSNIVTEARDQSQAEQSSQTTSDEGQPAASEAVEDDAATAKESGPKRELLGMYVTIRNKVNGEDVERPELKPNTRPRDFDWTVNYTITEIPEAKAWQIYHQIKKRRSTAFTKDPDARAEMWHRIFQGKLPSMADKGRKYREKRIQEETGQTVRVAWDQEPQDVEDFNAP